MGELRPEKWVPHLQKLRVVVLGKDPQVGLGGPVNAAVVGRDEPVRLTQSVCKLCVRKQLEIVIPVVVIVVDVLGRHRIRNLSVLGPHPRFERITALHPHQVGVCGVDVLVPV